MDHHDSTPHPDLTPPPSSSVPHSAEREEERTTTTNNFQQQQQAPEVVQDQQQAPKVVQDQQQAPEVVQDPTIPRTIEANGGDRGEGATEGTRGLHRTKLEDDHNTNTNVAYIRHHKLFDLYEDMILHVLWTKPTFHLKSNAPPPPPSSTTSGSSTYGPPHQSSRAVSPAMGGGGVGRSNSNPTTHKRAGGTPPPGAHHHRVSPKPSLSTGEELEDLQKMHHKMMGDTPKASAVAVTSSRSVLPVDNNSSNPLDYTATDECGDKSKVLALFAGATPLQHQFYSRTQIEALRSLAVVDELIDFLVLRHWKSI